MSFRVGLYAVTVKGRTVLVAATDIDAARARAARYWQYLYPEEDQPRSPAADLLGHPTEFAEIWETEPGEGD